MRSTPSDFPNLHEATGPYTVFIMSVLNIVLCFNIVVCCRTTDVFMINDYPTLLMRFSFESGLDCCQFLVKWKDLKTPFVIPYTVDLCFLYTISCVWCDWNGVSILSTS